MEKDFLDGKSILIVDDEVDVLETLEELLPMCEVAKADSFEKAKEFLDTRTFDLAILDIMGVDGYELLKIANEKGIIAVMLTAHAHSPESTIKSYEKGAASYVPKEKITQITTYLNDIFEAKKKGKHFWWRWLDRFGTAYDKKFGTEWRQDNRDFWDKFPM